MASRFGSARWGDEEYFPSFFPPDNWLWEVFAVVPGRCARANTPRKSHICGQSPAGAVPSGPQDVGLEGEPHAGRGAGHPARHPTKSQHPSLRTLSPSLFSPFLYFPPSKHPLLPQPSMKDGEGAARGPLWRRHPRRPRAQRVPPADARRRGRSRPPPRSKMAGGPKMVLSMRRHLQGWSHARRGLFMQRGIN